MREILFRGRRIDTGEWVYGHPVGWQNESGDISIVDSRFGACIDADGNLMMIEAPFVVKVDPATIGQFTGLTDKNGKKIFEGDIISESWGEPLATYRDVVIWENGGFYARDEAVNISEFCEVCGTIYDKEAPT